MEKEEYRYWFYTLEYVTDTESERLLREYKNIEEIYRLSTEHIEGISWLSQRAKESIVCGRNEKNIQEKVAYMRDKQIKSVTMTEKVYPERLKYLKRKPKILFYQGELPKEDIYGVAVIGARDCSNYGRGLAEEIGTALAEQGANVISGMARGIDGCAQRKALEAGGKSYGILGCGVDICYPKVNYGLYERLSRQGGIISEFVPGMRAKAMNFPQRNRIISGMCDAIVVVEAKKQSGTAITVEFGLEQGKDIYAVPGRITDVLSEGCNLLISQGAYPVLSIEEMLKNMGVFQRKNLKKQKKMQIPLESNLKLVYDCLDFIPKSVTKLVEETGMEDYEKINEILLDLEIDDRIQQTTTGYYVRKK